MKNTIEGTIIGIKPDVYYNNTAREIWSELLRPLPEFPEDFINEVKLALKASKNARYNIIHWSWNIEKAELEIAIHYS